MLSYYMCPTIAYTVEIRTDDVHVYSKSTPRSKPSLGY